MSNEREAEFVTEPATLLGRLRPAELLLNRDELFFRAGEAHAKAKYERGAVRRLIWPGLAAALGVVAAGLGIALVQSQTDRVDLAGQVARSTAAASYTAPQEHPPSPSEKQPQNGGEDFRQADMHGRPRAYDLLVSPQSPRSRRVLRAHSNWDSIDDAWEVAPEFADSPKELPESEDHSTDDSLERTVPPTPFNLRRMLLALPARS